MQLSLAAEEVATFYAKMLDHEYTSKETFQSNFFTDWREVSFSICQQFTCCPLFLPFFQFCLKKQLYTVIAFIYFQVMTADERKLIKKLSKCDFSKIHKYFLEKTEEKKNMTKEEKQVCVFLYFTCIALGT